MKNGLTTNEPQVIDEAHNDVQSTTAVQTSDVDTSGESQAAECEEQSRPLVTAEMVMRHLASADLRPNGDIARASRRIARKNKQSSGPELLSGAFVRLPNGKRVPLQVPPAALLIVTMKSIADADKRTRDKREEITEQHLDEMARASVSQGEHKLDPEQTLLRREERSAVCRLLDLIANGDIELGRLIDARVDGHLGCDLAEELGLTLVELATVQRRLKRRAVAHIEAASQLM